MEKSKSIYTYNKTMENESQPSFSFFFFFFLILTFSFPLIFVVVKHNLLIIIFFYVCNQHTFYISEFYNKKVRPFYTSLLISSYATWYVYVFLHVFLIIIKKN